MHESNLNCHLYNPMTLLKATIVTLSLTLTNITYATPINVNLASSFEISRALQVSQKLAENISMHCEYVTCRHARDLLQVPGMTRKILQRIQNELLFDMVQRGTGYSDDC